MSKVKRTLKCKKLTFEIINVHVKTLEIRPNRNSTKKKFDQKEIRPNIKCQTKIGGTKKQYIKPMIQQFLHPFTLNT